MRHQASDYYRGMRRFCTVLTGIMLITVTARSQWEEPVLMTETPQQTFVSVRSMSCSGDTIHTVWYDLRGQEWEIWYRRSIDDGATWDDEVRLTNDPGNSFQPTIASAGSNLYVTWHDSRAGGRHVFFKRSTDGGDSWSEDVKISGSEADESSPSVAALDNIVHVAWQQLHTEGLGIRYRRSIDYGATWEDPIDVSEQSGTDSSGAPFIVSSGSSVHLMWVRGNSAGAVTYQYRRSTDRGVTWGAPTSLAEKVSIDVYDAFYNHSLWSANGFVHAVYPRRGTDGEFRLEHLRSTDDGASWEESRVLATLTHPDSIAGYPIIGWRPPSVFGGDSTVHVAWSDLLPFFESDGSGFYSYTVLHARSTDGGATWQPTKAFGSETLEDENPHSGTAMRPNVVASATTTHILCHGFSDGYNLFYMRNPSGNLLSSVLRVNERMAEGSWSATPQIFSDETRITFHLERPSPVTLTLFDVMGNVVARPMAGTWIETSGSAVWDGTRPDGSAAPSGQYFYRIDAGSSAAVGSVMLVR